MKLRLKNLAAGGLCSLVFSWSGHAAFADTAAGKIACEEFYDVFTACKVDNTHTLTKGYEVQLDAETETVHTKFSFEYQFNCRENKLPISWHAGETDTPIAKATRWTQATVFGKGALKIFQTENSLDLSRSQYYPATCKVILRNIKVEPSTATIQDWRLLHADLTDRMTDAASTLDKINKLILYQDALEFMKKLADMILSELGRETRQQLATQGAELNEEIEQMLADSELGFSDTQRASLSKLSGLIGEFENDTFWVNEEGEPLTIADFLSPSERQIIEAILRQQTSMEDLQTERLDLMHKMSGWRETITSLNQLLQQWEGQ